jgi:hypothetical protein
MRTFCIAVITKSAACFDTAYVVCEVLACGGNGGPRCQACQGSIPISAKMGMGRAEGLE